MSRASTWLGLLLYSICAANPPRWRGGLVDVGMPYWGFGPLLGNVGYVRHFGVKVSFFFNFNNSVKIMLGKIVYCY